MENKPNSSCNIPSTAPPGPNWHCDWTEKTLVTEDATLEIESNKISAKSPSIGLELLTETLMEETKQ